MERRSLLEPHIECRVTATASASGIHIAESRILERTRHLTFAAYGEIVVLPLRPFHIHLSNFSRRAMQQPKQMEVAYAVGPPTSVVTASSTLNYWHQMGNTYSLEESALRNEHSAICEAEANTALSKARLVKHDNVRNLVCAVHYIPRTD